MEHRQDDVNGSECVSSQCFHQGGFCCLCLGSCALDLVPRFFLAILHVNTALFNERGREERKYQILLGTECQVHFRPHELQEQPCELAVSPPSPVFWLLQGKGVIVVNFVSSTPITAWNTGKACQSVKWLDS